jgi:hypothetical protein
MFSTKTDDIMDYGLTLEGILLKYIVNYLILILMISSIHKLIHGCNCTLSLKTFSFPSSISRIGEQEPNQLNVQHVNKMINFCDV